MRLAICPKIVYHFNQAQDDQYNAGPYDDRGSKLNRIKQQQNISNQFYDTVR